MISCALYLLFSNVNYLQVRSLALYFASLPILSNHCNCVDVEKMLKLLLVQGLRRANRVSQRITTARALFSPHPAHESETKRRHFVFSALDSETDLSSLTTQAAIIDRLRFTTPDIYNCCAEGKASFRPRFFQSYLRESSPKAFLDTELQLILVRSLSTSAFLSSFGNENLRPSFQYNNNNDEFYWNEPDSSNPKANRKADKIYNM